jgi:uncharacterized protein YgfB (UPF0149 family)
VRGGDSMPKARSTARNAHVTPTSATPSLDYDRLRDSLAGAGAVVAPAELHGGVCGALCAGGTPAANRWLTDCLDDLDLDVATAEMVGELDELVSSSSTMLADAEIKFEPLLPGDDAPLEEQVQALAQWCQGFLGGVGTTAPNAGRNLPEGAALAEILGDFAEISRAGLSETEAAGEGQPDFALAEIHEFVRISVQIVFEELRSERAAAARDVH